MVPVSYLRLFRHFIELLDVRYSCLEHSNLVHLVAPALTDQGFKLGDIVFLFVSPLFLLHVPGFIHLKNVCICICFGTTSILFKQFRKYH